MLKTLPRTLTRGLATAATPNKRTPLYDFHTEQDKLGKMVRFAGYDMPLSYEGKGPKVAGGAVAEHHNVRTAAGLFDVGHMVQSTYTGPGAFGFLQKVLPASLTSLAVQKLPSQQGKFASSLSVLLNENGGIIDDCMITKWAPEKFYLVTNAGRAARDMAWLEMHAKEWNENNKDQVKMEILSGWGLIALQGPTAAAALATLLPPSFPLSSLHFGQSAFAPLSTSTTSFHIARGGYTGEDGFEISLPPQLTDEITRKILDAKSVKLAGLAARDSLRLEAGLCLYGHDLDETVGVGEAGLAWVVGKDRRTPGAFIGAERTLAELKKGGTTRKRVGMDVEAGPPAREGAKIFALDGETQIGIITSGLPSPSTKTNISMGYIETKDGLNRKGSQVLVEVRKKMRKATVGSMPWITPGYYRGE